MRLRKSHPDKAGLTRRGRGKGFSYLDADGNVISDPEVVDRIRTLVIPPAWKDVWICPTRTVTSRPSAPTRPAAASTCTTRSGG